MINHSTEHSMFYTAIVCPPEVNEKILRFKFWMKEQFGCIVALKSPAHITLIPPFWLEEKRETDLRQTLHSFTSAMNEITIELEGFSHFTDRVLFINIKENAALNEIEKQSAAHFNHSFSDAIRKDQHPFHPHITIANRDLRPYHFEKAWEYFSHKEFKETFLTTTISLLRLNQGKWDVIAEKKWNVLAE